ncbi:MAG: baseplate J/gp47 family protein [Lachnospiraceae bacterium]|nr:baseplate J/gp47 family protein [Lachnospiraceae bacterium]
MLNSRNLDDRTYEELLAEAYTEIPMYSEEWTNFNPSDPGVTILENLTAFQILQQNRINEITPAVRQKLLEMVGFRSQKGRCARVLLAAEDQRQELAFAANQKFYLGDLCFETNRPIDRKLCHLTAVYSNRSGQWQDCSHLLDREVRVSFAVFGAHPQAGDSLWLLADALPEPGEEMVFYVKAAQRHKRNPLPAKGGSIFANIRWECYTREGFVPMHVHDDTGCLLSSGEIRMRLPEQPAAPCPEAPGNFYAVRAVLESAQYDVTPRLVTVSGFLFEVWQKDTRSICYTSNRTTRVSLKSEILKEGYITVFCREKKGSSYRKYTRVGVRGGKGRYFDYEEKPDGTLTWIFDRDRFGYGPEKLKNAVKIVAYSEEIMRRFSLGEVLGVDHQEISLPAGYVVAESFCIIARRLDENGEELYDFVHPSRFGEDDLSYYLYEDEGKIVIEDAGPFIGASLYMGAFAVTRGGEGNIREGNTLLAEGLTGGQRFYNPGPGTRGCFRENLEQVKRRFLEDLQTPYTAVTAADYERIVKETPQLCIHKVKAFMDESRNLVRIAVKPDTDEKFPELSEIYRTAIERQLENRRLLTTRIEIVGPVYTQVDVQGTVCVKRHSENSLQEIIDAVRKAMDCVSSERGFGEPLRFDQIFRCIEALDCVAFVSSLSLHPQNQALARLQDSDVIPAQNCLCSPGEIRIETVTSRT